MMCKAMQCGMLFAAARNKLLLMSSVRMMQNHYVMYCRFSPERHGYVELFRVVAETFRFSHWSAYLLLQPVATNVTARFLNLLIRVLIRHFPWYSVTHCVKRNAQTWVIQNENTQHKGEKMRNPLYKHFSKDIHKLSTVFHIIPCSRPIVIHRAVIKTQSLRSTGLNK